MARLGYILKDRACNECCWFANWPPNTDAKERVKEEADPSRLVGGRFNTQMKLHARLVLGAASRPPHLPARIIKMCIEVSVSHIFIPDGLNTLLSQSCVLENSSSCGIVGRKVHRAWDEEPQIASV